MKPEFLKFPRWWKPWTWVVFNRKKWRDVKINTATFTEETWTDSAKLSDLTKEKK